MAAIVCAGLAGCGSTSSALSTLRPVSAASSTSGTIRLFASVTSNGKASVVVTGVIGDDGRSFPADKTGKADSNDNFEEVVLKRGTFLLDERALSDKRPNIHYNSSTCSLSLTVAANVPLSNGTGVYAGIHGSVHATANVATVEPRSASGPDRGSCEDKKPPAAAYFGDLVGVGVATF